MSEAHDANAVESSAKGPAKAPARPPRSWRRRAVFALVPTLAFFALGETLCRIYERVRYGSAERAGTPMYEPDPDDPGVTELRPNTDLSGASMQIHINSLRFRGREVVVPKPAGTIRVVCIGASTTFDILAKSDAATWPALLEKKLRAKHPQVEVVNAGVPGHTVDNFLRPAKQKRIAALDPDVVVAYFATNEVSQEAQHLFRVEQPAPTLLQKTVKTVTDWSLFAYKIWLFGQTYVSKPVEHEGQHELPESCALDFERKLHELARRTKAENARLALGTFALRWRADQPAEKKRALAAGCFGIYEGLSIDGIDKAFHAYNDAIGRVAKSEGGVVIPVADELSGDPTLFGDFVHFGADGLGSERMATLVARELEAAHALDR